MIRKSLPLATFSASVLVLSIVPFLSMRGGPLDEYRIVAIRLRELAALEAGLDEVVLRARSDRDLHWDRVVSVTASIEEMQRDLGPRVSRLVPVDGPRLAGRFQAYLDSSAERMVVVERFKSEHAVFRNSMRYLPTAAESLMQAPTGVMGKVDHELALLTVHVMKSVFGHSPEDSANLLADLDLASETGSGGAPRPLGTFVEHARRSLRARESVDSLLSEILDHRADHTFLELLREFEEHEAVALRRAGMVRATLAALALVLGAAVGYAMLRLRQGASKLEHLNATLEMRVRDRTEDLESEVAQRRLAEERARKLADFDNLTGLPNRRLFLDRIDQTLAERRRDRARAALLFMDLDGFKQVNDVYGHDFGDALLREVSQRLAGCLRASDSVSRGVPDDAAEAVLARQGGDEFIVLAGRIRASEDASRIAQRMIAAVAAPFAMDGHELHVGVSIGISVYPDDAEDPDTLLRNADLALYAVKARGRGRFAFFSREMHERVTMRARVETELRRGLSEGQFVLHYQPKVSVAAGRVDSVEALLHWQHTDRGLLLPDAFIEVAEQSDLIEDLAGFALERACLDAREWLAAARPLRVGVNVPPRLVQVGMLEAHAARAIERSGLPPDLLEIEITEKCLLENEAEAASRLRALRERGLHIALDDFGTGYSSLSHLRSLPLDWLKMDRSLTVRLDEVVGVVRAVIDLAHSSGLRVVADGVEDRAQAELLLELGCDALQGFLFSHAVPRCDLGAAIERADALLPELMQGRGRARVRIP